MLRNRTMNKILMISTPLLVQLVFRDALPRCVQINAKSLSEAEDVCSNIHPDIIVMYLEHMNETLETALKRFRSRKDPPVPLFIISKPKPLDFALELSCLDDVHYIPLPLDEMQLKLKVIRTVGTAASSVSEPNPVLHTLSAQLIGASNALQQAKDLICSYAGSNEHILIIGETGTGKEIAAKMIHELSRKHSPYRCINCSALSEGLAESELFGHVKGAFTGADQNHKGYFLTCSSGSLFMDEIGDLSLNLQPKLLRVLEEKHISRVGDTRPVQVNTRVITATNRNLEALIAEGLFRADLYHRISTLQIHIPPLRDRTEDIPLLVNHFLREFPGIRFTPSAIEELQKYHWPGNVRELRTVVVRTCIRFCAEQSEKNFVSAKIIRKTMSQFFMHHKV